MNHAIDATRYAMNQDQIHMQVIMNNISNINTPAYKRQLSEISGFEHMLQPEMQAIHQQINHIFSQGTLKETGNPAHLALTDNSFFQVRTESGILYTRRGDFMVNAAGNLGMPTGALLMGTQGSIHVGDQPFTMNTQGEIFINNQKIDQLQILQFAHPESLQYLGEGLFQTEEKPDSAPAINQVLQGYLETSNVKSLEEMADLTQTARHFETSQRILRMADSMTATAINQLGENRV